MFKSKHMLIILALGILAIIYYSFSGLDLLYWLIIFLMYFVYSCLGITITFHRFLAHNSYNFKSNIIKNIFIFFGSLAGTGSAIGWVSIHRKHHKHSDGEKDPHRPQKYHENVIYDYDNDIDYTLVKDLLKSKYLTFIHKCGLYIMLLFYCLLFILGGFSILFAAGIIPQSLTILISLISNYVNHSWGYRNYDINDESKNNWVLALITWGESWHNNHHAKPMLYSFKHKW